MSPDQKGRRGRPRWQPPDRQAVEDLAARGLTEGQIAAALGISHDTLINKKREFSEFSEAIARGKAKGVETIANVLFDKAQAGNLTAIIFYLRTRGGWHEPAAQVHAFFQPKATASLTDEELMEIARKGLPRS